MGKMVITLKTEVVLVKRGFLNFLKLNNEILIEKCIMSTSLVDLSTVCQTISIVMILNLVTQLTDLVMSTSHFEYVFKWIHWICLKNHFKLQSLLKNPFLRCIRCFWRELEKLHLSLLIICDHNKYSLNYIIDAEWIELLNNCE